MPKDKTRNKRCRTRQEVAAALGISRITLWRRLKKAGLVLQGKHLLTPADCAAIQALFGQEEQPQREAP